MIDPKQLAREMAEKCSLALNNFNNVSAREYRQIIDGTSAVILHELNLEQLIADKQRLDWLENYFLHYKWDDAFPDFRPMSDGRYSEKYIGEGITIRQAIDNAMKGKP